MESASRAVGIVIIISIVWTKVTKSTARCVIVPNPNFDVPMAAVYPVPNAVTACTTVRISVTKTIAMSRVWPAPSSNVPIRTYASTNSISAMAITTVPMVRMKRIAHVRRMNSNAKTIDALRCGGVVMVGKTVSMAAMNRLNCVRPFHADSIHFDAITNVA